jgi:hypothetical protein
MRKVIAAECFRGEHDWLARYGDALGLTALQPQTERNRLDRSVHRAEKGPSGHDDAGQRLDPPDARRLRDRRHHPGRKTLVKRPTSCDLNVSQQAAWGMSAEKSSAQTFSPGQQDTFSFDERLKRKSVYV